MFEYSYREAVCMVEAQSRVYNSDAYVAEQSTRSSGTAFFVKLKPEGKAAIITCAHVVSCADGIDLQFVRKNGAILRCAAKVKKRFDCIDLALLELDSRHPNAEQFQSEVDQRALLIYDGQDSLDQLKVKTVIVCGYQLSRSPSDQSETKGTIARLLTETISYSSYAFTVFSITNRVNGGFSGGPLIIDDGGPRVIGVIHQGAHQEHIDGEHGAVLWLYLKLLLLANENNTLMDLRGLGVFPGICQKLQSTDHRAFLGLKPEQSGVRISKIPLNSIFLTLQDSTGQPLVKVGDIILNVNGLPISNEGNVLHPILKTPVRYTMFAFNCAPLGSTVKLEIGRTVTVNGVKELRVQTVEIPNTQTYEDFHLIKERHDPIYLFAGGVVFRSYSRDMVSYLSYEQEKPVTDRNLTLLGRRKNKHQDEIVVAELAFNHPYLEQYECLRSNPVVTHFQNEQIRDLYHLQEMLEQHRTLNHPYFCIQLENDEVVWLQHFTKEMEQSVAGERNLDGVALSKMNSQSYWNDSRKRRAIAPVGAEESVVKCEVRIRNVG